MQFRQIGLVVAMLAFVTPTFANQCPSADKVRVCSGDRCSFQRLSGWSESIFYSDQGKPFTFLKANYRDSRLNCYYSYVDPNTHRKTPPALVLRAVD